jgi:hypothetical protein
MFLPVEISVSGLLASPSGDKRLMNFGSASFEEDIRY